MIKKITIFSLLFFSTFMMHTYAMEEREHPETTAIECKESDFNLDSIIIKTIDDKTLILSPQEAQQSETLNELLSSFGQLDDNVIDLRDFKLKNADILNYEILDILFHFDDHKENLNDPTILYHVFHTAQVLRMKRKIKRKIALHLHRINPKILSDAQFLHEWLECCNSIEYLLKANKLPTIIDNKLDLSNCDIDDLTGLNKLANTNVEELLLDNNNLDRIDISTIFQLFPNLKHFSAHSNHIVYLIMPPRVPENVLINLANNDFNYIPLFKTERSQIVLPSSVKNIKQLFNFLEPSILKKYKAHLKFLCEIFLLHAVISGINYPLGTLFTIFIMNHHSKLPIFSYRNQIFII